MLQHGVVLHFDSNHPAGHKRGYIKALFSSECPRAYVGQTGRQCATRMKEHQRRQDENALVALTTGYGFYWARTSVIGNC